jgi:SAM-dependent methyltransferase
VRAIAGDFATIRMPLQSFDFVVGKAFLHHLTHEVEEVYLEKVSRVLRPEGEARFSEPAVNSRLLDELRWMIPVPGRPSSLNAGAFARYKQTDPHPERDNSSYHYQAVASKFFSSVRIVPLGSVQRLERLLPKGTVNDSFSRFAFKLERGLPSWMRLKLARAQLLVFREPTCGLPLADSAPVAAAGALQL